MKIENVDQLYRLVLQGRELQAWADLFFALGVTGAIAAGIAWLDTFSGAGCTLSTLVAMVLTAGDVAAWYVSASYTAKRAALPTDADLKIVGGYLTGEKVLGSEKFDKLSNAAIMYLEKQAKEEGSHEDTAR